MNPMDDNTTSDSTMSKTAAIRFLSPDRLLPGQERRSKLLDPASSLVRYLDPVRTYCRSLSREFDCRPWHIELVGPKEDPSVAVGDRAQELEGAEVSLSLDSYAVMNEKAYVLQTPSVTGYGPTHITVGYFRNEISAHMKAQIESYVAGLT